MKNLLIISLAVLSFNALAKDKVLLQCSTLGDSLSDVQVIVDAKNDQYIKVITMDQKSKKFMIMMPTLFNKNAKVSKTYSAARFPDSASGGEVDEAVMLEVNANKKSARLDHKGSVFFLDCR